MGLPLSVTGETDAGWCAATPPNETTDDDGNPVFRQAGFSALDPRAPRRRVYDDPDVQALREHLRLHNGMPGLEIVEPHEIERATRIFFRDGFVVVRDLLDPETLQTLRAASAHILGQILDIPGVGGRKYITETARLPHRYSYGTASASRQLLHEPEWAAMIDLPTTTPILKSLFGGPEYLVTGAGGDLCLPGAIEYQTLHSDFREQYELPEARLEQARRVGVKSPAVDGKDEVGGVGGGELEYRTRQLIYERTPPRVVVNFLMSDLTWENGPIRQIPGTQTRPANPPSQADEPEWMRLSTLVGAPAGAGIFRDLRAWHGATPNVGKEIRAMPNVEYGSSWLDDRYFSHCMPHAVWETLSDHAKSLCTRIKTEPGVWPAGAGTMHPLARERALAKGVVEF